MGDSFRPSEMDRHDEVIAGVPVMVMSYAVGRRFSCRIENADGSGSIARASGATREEAVASAKESAALSLEMRSATARLRDATAGIRSHERDRRPADLASSGVREKSGTSSADDDRGREGQR